MRWPLALLLGLLVNARAATPQQSLGHKMLGTVGIDAGVQSPSGLYVGDRFMWYGATKLTDRNGDAIPIPGLDMDAFGNMLGVGFITRLRTTGPYLSFAAGAPYARLLLSVDDPRTVLDFSGFGDVFVQPAGVGWRGNGYDAVAQYTFYAPTGKFVPKTGGGVGRGFWTHQLAAGGAVFRGENRAQRASALVSYDLNLKKRGIDIRRGNTVQVQGGVGVTVLEMLTVGVAGFAMWQVTDDVGADIPAVLRDLSTRGFGIGPEIGIVIPALRLQADLRFERELGGRSRPQGQLLTFGIGRLLWAPTDVRPMPESERNALLRVTSPAAAPR
ncbi:MAG: SphA family protein [Gemmatimonadaceae bacterium]